MKFKKGRWRHGEKGWSTSLLKFGNRRSWPFFLSVDYLHVSLNILLVWIIWPTFVNSISKEIEFFNLEKDFITVFNLKYWYLPSCARLLHRFSILTRYMCFFLTKSVRKWSLVIYCRTSSQLERTFYEKYRDERSVDDDRCAQTIEQVDRIGISRVHIRRGRKNRRRRRRRKQTCRRKRRGIFTISTKTTTEMFQGRWMREKSTVSTPENCYIVVFVESKERNFIG